MKIQRGRQLDDIYTNLNFGAVEKQKRAILQTCVLYVLHAENIKVKTSHLLGTRYIRFTYSTE